MRVIDIENQSQKKWYKGPVFIERYVDQYIKD